LNICDLQQRRALARQNLPRTIHSMYSIASWKISAAQRDQPVTQKEDVLGMISGTIILHVVSVSCVLSHRERTRLPPAGRIHATRQKSMTSQRLLGWPDPNSVSPRQQQDEKLIDPPATSASLAGARTTIVVSAAGRRPACRRALATDLDRFVCESDADRPLPSHPARWHASVSTSHPESGK